MSERALRCEGVEVDGSAGVEGGCDGGDDSGKSHSRSIARRLRMSEATTPVPRIAAIAGSEYSGPILPTNSAAAIFAPMKTSSTASAVLR